MQEPEAHWERLESEEIEQKLSTDFVRGLAVAEVVHRQEQHGKNVFEKKRDWGLLGTVLRQFRSPLVFILLVAGIGTLVLREFIDAAIIFTALFINVAAGVVQEERAGRAFDKLNRSQEHFATVIRDGRKMVIPAEDLVVGDVVEIKGGSYIPADMRLIQAKDLSVSEAALTGEWADVFKENTTLTATVPLTERKNTAWMGTIATAGSGRGVVVAIGDDTELGEIAQELVSVEESATPLQQSIRLVARFLVLVIAAAIAAIVVLGLFRGEDFGEMLLVAIALAVATMPAGLPAAVTIVLALGMEAILKRGGLVRNLLAAETLGATTIILTDKTGTLTEAKMRLASLYTLESLEREGREEWTADDREMLKAAVLSSDAFVEERGTEGKSTDQITVHGRPVERAIVLAGIDAGLSQYELAAEYPQLDFLQFQSSRRFGASLNMLPDGKRKRLFIKGAPETLLESSSHVYRAGKEKKLTAALKEQFAKLQEARSADGMRFIAVAYKNVNRDAIAREEKSGRTFHDIPDDLVFLGLISFEDPVRADVAEAIKEVKGAGARVLMVTGDNQETARKIACDVGIACEPGEVRTGSDIEKANDRELYEMLQSVKIFARTLPIQKLRLARILKNRGEVVAMTGDGINDAPALRSANIGVAVGSGTEVAKEASDMVLINNSFSIIVAAIKEGRKIIENLRKVIAYLLSTSFSEIFVIGAALIAGAPLPILPAQILWANIIEEGLMSFPLAFEKPDGDLMKHSPRSHSARNILTPRIKELILIVSGVTGVLLVGLYFVLLNLGLPIEEIRTIIFVALSLDAIFFVFSLKSLHLPLWKINPFNNPFLLGALGISVLLLIAAVTLEPLRFLLSLTPLTVQQAVLLSGIGLFNLLTIEMAKHFIFKQSGSDIEA